MSQLSAAKEQQEGKEYKQCNDTADNTADYGSCIGTTAGLGRSRDSASIGGLKR